MRFTFLGLLLPAMAGAETVKIGGLYYNLDGEAMTAEVVNEFGYTVSGKVVIPGSVDYEGGTYAVTRIGDYAFSTSTDVTEVEIPVSVCDAAGRLLTEGKADGHAIVLQTGQKAGQMAIVKVGEQTIKVMTR